MPDVDDVPGRLDEAYGPWRERLTGAQLRALIAWQAPDRGYERLQRALATGEGVSASDRKTVGDLLTAIYTGRVPFAIQTWRGVRSTDQTFGLPSDQLEHLIGRQIQVGRFFAVSTELRVAADDFTVPPLSGGPAIMSLSIPPDQRAAWVSLAGDESMSGQRELLLGPEAQYRVTGVSNADGIAIVEAEVI